MNANSLSRATITMFAALVASCCCGCFLCSSNDGRSSFVSAYSHHRLPSPKRVTPSVVADIETTCTRDNSEDSEAGSNRGKSRRGFFRAGIAAVVATTTTTTAIAEQPRPASATDGVISGKYCAYGEGGDCEDLAGGNPYILELQRKSAANKQATIKSAENAFYAKNYPDWFAAVGKTMVQKESDGTFVVVDDAELAKLWEQNKISVKTPTTMGGRIKDVTQKPMLVLKE